MIDLSLFCKVTPAVDGSTVSLGRGAKWIDVYKALDEKGLVVIGGRNSPVDVGGLTLQGNVALDLRFFANKFQITWSVLTIRIKGRISFYSPRFSFICSSVMSYEVILANCSVITASASVNPELWRVLRGGSNNFSIVTHFRLRSLPSAPL